PDYFDGSFSTPRGPSGGDAALLCRWFGSERVREGEAILRAPLGTYTLASERHAELANAPGIPAPGLGYKSLGQQSLEHALDRTDLVAALRRERALPPPPAARGEPLVPPALVNGMLAERPPGPTQYSATFRDSDGRERR